MFLYVGKYLRLYKKQFIIGPLLKMVEAVFELMLPMYMARIINEGIIPKNTSLITSLGLRMLITVIVSLLCAAICQYCASVASQGFGTKVRNGMFSHVKGLSFAEYDRFGTDTLTTRITNDINQLQVAVAMSIRLVSRAPVVSIGAIILSVMMDQSLSVTIWVGVISFLVVLLIIMLSAFPLYARVQKQLDGVGSVLRENLSGVRVIRAFDRTASEWERFVLAVDRHKDTVVKVTKVASLMTPATTVIMNLLICAVLWFGANRVHSGDIEWGNISAFISYIGLILNALLVVANLVVIFTKSAASLMRINEVFAAPSSDRIEEEKTKKEKDGEELLSFSHVHFSYTGDAEKNTLTDIDFTLKKGETLGVIGGTGSGKTTLISLLLRFYEKQKGEIYLLENPLHLFSEQELRSQMAVVFQNPRLFSGTIMENLRWGNEAATKEDMEEALSFSQAMEFIKKLPEGLDTHIERGGVNFSGGQKQRLSIARALIRKPPLLILDDSSSALDYETEARLRAAVRKCQKENKMSVIMISQRIASVRYASKILVLEDGRQVGLGTHDELMKNCPEYRDIALSQLSEKEVS